MPDDCPKLYVVEIGVNYRQTDRKYRKNKAYEATRSCAEPKNDALNHKTPPTDYGSPMKPFFLLKSQTFGIRQTNWADKLWGIWDIFGRTISAHFGTVSPLSMFSIIQPLLFQKTKPLYPHPKYLFGIGIGI